MLSRWLEVRERVRVGQSTRDRACNGRRVHQEKSGPVWQGNKTWFNTVKTSHGTKHNCTNSTVKVTETNSRYVQGMTGECTYTVFGLRKRATNERTKTRTRQPYR
jgi:phosphoribosylformylglycinamidine (FGAM) synthase-like amidotransferase family enzyme